MDKFNWTLWNSYLFRKIITNKNAEINLGILTF